MRQKNDTTSTQRFTNLEIVYECEHLISVNKPGGLLTQAPSGIDSIELRTKRYLRKQQSKPQPGKTYLGVPHRLDRPASGIMIFAKDKPTARYLADRFQRREVRKNYWAILSGTPPEDEGTWTDFMRKIPDEAKSEIVDDQHSDAQLAILHYRVKHGHDDKSLVEIQLETGRSHQIRLQAASRGLPILGDQLYGCSLPFGPQYEDIRRRAIVLHARHLQIRHPNSGELLELVAPLPETWRELGFSLV